MFNVGLGEMLLLAVLGLLVFGPDRLPAAVSKATATIRQLRDMAATARNQITEAAGVDEEQASKALNDLRDLHPRRLAASVLEPERQQGSGPARPAKAVEVDPDLA